MSDQKWGAEAQPRPTDMDTAEHRVLFDQGREPEPAGQDPPATSPAQPEGDGDHDAGGHDEGSMRQVDDARLQTLEPIELPLAEAFGCVLASDIVALSALPPFASSAMDGFAVRASDIAAAGPDRPVSLKVVGRSMAGHPPDATVGAGEAMRIATGAPVPAGADAILPVEHAWLQGDSVQATRAFDEGAYVRPSGQDASEGELLIPAGRRISAPELGLVASAGYGSILVHPRPRVAILATGDELVEPGRQAPFGAIRDSNSFTLFGGVRETGAVPVLGGIVKDEVDELRDAILGLTTRSDCFISSGGVSVGERDVVKMAFFRRGDVAFYRVAMQPGMPQGFGNVEGRPYFGLPGNPVSVFVSFEVFIRPALLKMMGRRDLFRPEVEAILDTDISGPVNKTVFARVRVRREAHRWVASSTGPGQSNLLSTVARANGLAVIPVGVETAQVGDRVRVMLFRALEGER